MSAGGLEAVCELHHNVQSAARLAQLHDDIMRMPMQLSRSHRRHELDTVWRSAATRAASACRFSPD